MDLVLIDAGGANLGSVNWAFRRLGVEPRIVQDAAALGTPDRIVLPGVGAARHGMELLRKHGWVDALQQSNVPLLGICLGMQLLFEHSEEGDVDCLGLIAGEVKKLAASHDIRIPHMGWNSLQQVRPSSLLAGIAENTRMYFVHGYAASRSAACIARSRHGEEFPALVSQGHVCGAQFHPERSGAAGARLLQNFLEWQP